MTLLTPPPHPTVHSDLAAPQRSGAVIALTPFRAEITRALARRGKRLLEAADLAEQMGKLAPLEAFFTIKELGIEDALPLLVHASPQQLQACIDLDCWHRDDLKVAELDAWLAPFGAEGPQALAKAFFALDEEVQVLYLAKTVQVYDIRSEEAPTAPEADLDQAHLNTPDGLFVLTHRGVDDSSVGESEYDAAADGQGSPDSGDDCDDDDSDAKPWELEVEPFVLVRALYEVDPEEAMRVLVASKWELQSTLLEQAFGFRNARMADLGFADRAESMQIFSPPPQAPPTQPLHSSAPCPLPGLYATALHPDSLFVAAMGHIVAPQQLERLEGELICLVNALVVACGHGPRDMAAVVQMAGQVRDTLSFGLLSLQGAAGAKEANVAAAQADLLAWPLRSIFQHGHHQSRELRKLLRRAKNLPQIRALLACQVESDSPQALDQAFLKGLSNLLPLRAAPTAQSHAGAFCSAAEVQESLQQLQSLVERLCGA
jgi:hypothetical protein